MLPGFRVELVAPVPGFASSVVTDSKGTIYCTTTDGWIHRIDGATAVPLVAMPTKAGGNGGLLGMALLDDATAVVHYTTWITTSAGERVRDDVIATVDLPTGGQQVVKVFPGDIGFPDRGVSNEHHGGNPTIGPDGAIFVGIGEYGTHWMSQDREWNGGKIWRIDRAGSASQFAIGMRNPYDLAWDPELERIVVADNGPDAGDEMHVLGNGDNAGWPRTFGNQPPFAGAVPPVYVFPNTVAPTGLHRLAGAVPMLRRGYLLGTFVNRAVYYFPDFTRTPIALATFLSGFVIDVTESPAGAVYLATAWGSGSQILRLRPPGRGDCNGDGLTDWRDVLPSVHEIDDGGVHPMIDAQDGAHAGTWGCDANANGLIDDGDLDALVKLISSRRRAVRR